MFYATRFNLSFDVKSAASKIKDKESKVVSSTASSLDDAFLIAQSLKPGEKLELISRIWDNLRLTEGFRPSDDDLVEIQRRSAELDAGNVEAIPWEVVRDSVRARIARHE